MLPGQFVQQRWGQHAALLGGILHSNFCFVRAALFAVQSKRENKARVPARRLLHSLTKRGPRGHNLSWASRLSLTNIYNRLSAGQSFAWCRRRRQRCELRSHFVVAHLWCLGKLPLSLLSLCVYHRYIKAPACGAALNDKPREFQLHLPPARSRAILLFWNSFYLCF